MEPLRLFVDGTPRPKGSPWPKVTKDGRPFLVDDSTVKRWQTKIKWAARMALPTRPVRDAVIVQLEFVLKRPKKPKYSWPVRGDVDKLARAVLDGIEGVAYADDSQVVALVATKRFAIAGEKTGVLVQVWPR